MSLGVTFYPKTHGLWNKTWEVGKLAEAGIFTKPSCNGKFCMLILLSMHAGVRDDHLVVRQADTLELKESDATGALAL
eukprot:1159102-Pelagomonas_calceolata.AAC.3